MRVYQAPALPSRSDVLYTAEGVTTMNYPFQCVRASGVPVIGAASGTPTGSLIGLRAGDVITNLVTQTQTNGTALTFAKMALYDISGNFLVATGSVSATFNAAAGTKIVPLTAPYTVPTTGGYFVIYLQYGSGATGAAISSATGGSLPVGTLNYSVVDVTFRTDLSAGLTLTNTSNSYLFGVS